VVQQGSDCYEINGYGNVIDITTDVFGDIYTIGYFEESVDFDPGPDVYELSSNGETDIFVTKLNANGQFVWAYSFGSSESDFGLGIKTDTSGNVYLTGGFKEAIDFDPGLGTYFLSSIDSDDIFVLKLDPAGSFIWARNMGGASSSAAYSIAVDDAGNVYTTGYFTETADFDPGSGIYNLTANGNAVWVEDIFISKLNSNGDFVWAKSIGGQLEDIGKSIALDSANNVYISGYFESDSVDFDPGLNQFNIAVQGYRDAFITKLTSNGDFIWTKTIGALNGLDITIGEGGNVYATGGYFVGNIDLDPGSGTSYTSDSSGLFVLKLDTNGDYLWAKLIDASPPVAWKNPIAIDKDYNVYTSGRFVGTVMFDPDTGTFYVSGNNDAFVTKLNKDGSFIWTSSFTGIWGGRGRAIVLDDWDNIYTTGSFFNAVDFDPDTSVYELIAVCDSDIFVHKMRQQPCTASPTINSTNTSFSICNGDSIHLSAVLPSGIAGFSYAWNTGATSDAIVVAPDVATTYSVAVYFSPSCSDTASVVVTVYPPSEPLYLTSTTCDPNAAGTTEYFLTDQNGCDSLIIETITLVLSPAMPDAPANIIIQPDNPPFTLTVPVVPNATSYAWQVPAGVQIVSGGNLNSVVLGWGGMTTGGQVCVTAINDCGSSPAACTQIIVDMEIGVDDLAQKDYSLYPNPTSNWLSIVFPNTVEGTYELRDVGGILVSNGILNQQTYLSFEHHPQGVYILLLQTKAGIWAERLVRM
jgi:PKD-like domain/Beta-propeller repeat